MSLLFIFASVLESSVGVAYSWMAGQRAALTHPRPLKSAAVVCRAAAAFILLFGFVQVVSELEEGSMGTDGLCLPSCLLWMEVLLTPMLEGVGWFVTPPSLSVMPRGAMCQQCDRNLGAIRMNLILWDWVKQLTLILTVCAELDKFLTQS